MAGRGCAARRAPQLSGGSSRCHRSLGGDARYCPVEGGDSLDVALFQWGSLGEPYSVRLLRIFRPSSALSDRAAEDKLLVERVDPGLQAASAPGEPSRRCRQPPIAAAQGLPANNPNPFSEYYVPGAQAKALGLEAANNSGTDGWVGFNS